MAIKKITIGEHPYKAYNISLGNRPYELTARASGRSSRWSIDLQDMNTREFLWQGLKLMPNNFQTFFTAPDFRENVGIIEVRPFFDWSTEENVTGGNIGNDTHLWTLTFTDRTSIENIQNAYEEALKEMSDV
jgi:hypothetical protein